MLSTPTIDAALRAATESLADSGSDSPSLDAAVLLCHTLDKSRSYLLTWPDKSLSEQEHITFRSLIERRVKGEPIAYITGVREFWSLPLMVSPSTLIPRPDTERLVELALKKVTNPPSHILDLGTGTGAIALALASECPLHTVWGVDIREEAKLLAEKNAQSLAINNAHFLAGSWFEPIKNLSDKTSPSGIKFALIVSNPPYIDQDDPHLAKGDVRFEPKSALVADDKGLADIKMIATGARDYLDANGWLFFEHGYEQGAAVRDILVQLGYSNIETALDYAEHERVTFGQLLAVTTE